MADANRRLSLRPPEQRFVFPDTRKIIPRSGDLARITEEVTRRVKLRNLIDSPTTPQPEREAALAALARLTA